MVYLQKILRRVLLFTLTSTIGVHMALGGWLGAHTLYSGVSGQVFMEGQPVANLVVEQKVWRSTHKKHVQTTQTNDQGFFKFDEVKQNKGLLDLLPGEIVIQQEIHITYQEKPIKAWVFTKRDGKKGSETSQKDFSLVCELTRKPELTGNYYGICQLEDSK